MNARWQTVAALSLALASCAVAGCDVCPPGETPINFQCRKSNCPPGTMVGPASEDPQDPESQRGTCVCASDASWNAEKKTCENPCPPGSSFDYGGRCCKSDSGCAALPSRHRVAVGYEPFAK